MSVHVSPFDCSLFCSFTRGPSPRTLKLPPLRWDHANALARRLAVSQEGHQGLSQGMPSAP